MPQKEEKTDRAQLRYNLTHWRSAFFLCILIVSYSVDQELRSVDLAEDLVQEGIKAAGYQMYDGPYRFLDMSWSCLEGKTNYPFTLLLAQHHTERILVSKLTSLGVSVKWEHKAVSIIVGDGGVTVGFENGSMITARYVVGADGSHSSVKNCRLHLCYNTEGVHRFELWWDYLSPIQPQGPHFGRSTNTTPIPSG